MKKAAFILYIPFIFSPLLAQKSNFADFSVSEIILKTATGNLAGTLTIPERPRKTPLVIIIPGSGETDRDCNTPSGIQTNAYKKLAEGFALNGISTLRFDKRGVGASSEANGLESDLRFETYINDVIAWAALANQNRKFSTITLLGHSEGSLIGMIAAGQAEIAAFVSVAGAGKTADKLMKEQLHSLPPKLVEESYRIIDSLEHGKMYTQFNPGLMPFFRVSAQPYLISWIKYDPALIISKLNIPVMIIHGTADLQIAVENARLLYEARPDAKFLLINRMNHILKDIPGDRAENMASYRKPELPLSDLLVKEIVDFVKPQKVDQH